MSEVPAHTSVVSGSSPSLKKNNNHVGTMIVHPLQPWIQSLLNVNKHSVRINWVSVKYIINVCIYIYFFFAWGWDNTAVH